MNLRAAIDPRKLSDVYDRAASHYDLQHALLTFRSDQRGRQLVVKQGVREGDQVLDCGAGTGTSSFLAAGKAGKSGHVTLFDMSEGMLEEARSKAQRLGLNDRVDFKTGDILALPFADGSFDCVLSTYSICPLYDPAKGALEMWRVLKPGGRLAVAHSVEPRSRISKWLGDHVENIAWRFPWLTLGCRAVNVLPALEHAGGKLIFKQYLGFPLWPFVVFVVEKPIAA